MYAIRINNRKDIVVLFNGGEKTAQTNEQSKDLNIKFHEAQIFAKKIEEAIYDGIIIIDDKKRKLISFDGQPEIFL